MHRQENITPLIVFSSIQKPPWGWLQNAATLTPSSGLLPCPCHCGKNNLQKEGMGFSAASAGIFLAIM